MHCEQMVPYIISLIASYVDRASFPSIAAMEAKQFKFQYKWENNLY